MNRLVHLTMLLVLPLLFSSCSSKIFGGKKNKKKDVATSQSDTTNTTVPHPITTGIPTPTISTAKRELINSLSQLWNKRLDYKTFSGKAKINFDGPSGSVGFSANFRVAKDSLVWVHISALGGLYSVARILVTPDSFFMINYDQKEVTYLPIANAAKILPVPVSFYQLQNLFIGEPLAGGTITDAEVNNAVWSLHTEDSTYDQQLTYQQSDSLMTIGSLQTHAPNGPKATIDYNNYETVDKRKISTYRTVHLQNGVNNYTLDMNFVNSEFDKELDFPFSMPKNYTVKNP